VALVNKKMLIVWCHFRGISRFIPDVRGTNKIEMKQKNRENETKLKNGYEKRMKRNADKNKKASCGTLKIKVVIYNKSPIFRGFYLTALYWAD
jgi:hypothetical protein